MGMAVEFSPERTREQRGAEPGLPGHGEVQSWGNNIFIWFCSRNRLVAFPLWLSYSQWVVSYILCYITFKSDKVCLVCLLVYHLWAVVGPAVEGGGLTVASSEGLTCSLAAQDQVPSVWYALMGLCLRCKAPELLWIWDGQQAIQTPVEEYHPLFLLKSTTVPTAAAISLLDWR